MKEKILEALAGLGFKLEAMENLGYVFDYDGIKFCYMCGEDDRKFLNIGIIGLRPYSETDTRQYYAVVERVNSTMKCVKAYTFADWLGLFYEREMFGDENLADVLRQIILRLEAGLLFARRIIYGIETMSAYGHL